MNIVINSCLHADLFGFYNIIVFQNPNIDLSISILCFLKLHIVAISIIRGEGACIHILLFICYKK